MAWPACCAPCAGLHPRHADRGHHHRHRQYFDPFARDAEEGDHGQREQGWQRDGVEHEPLAAARGRQLVRPCEARLQQAAEPGGGQGNRGKGGQRCNRLAAHSQAEVSHAHAKVALFAERTHHDLWQRHEHAAEGHPEQEQPCRGSAIRARQKPGANDAGHHCRQRAGALEQAGQRVRAIPCVVVMEKCRPQAWRERFRQDQEQFLDQEREVEGQYVKQRRCKGQAPIPWGSRSRFRCVPALPETAGHPEQQRAGNYRQCNGNADHPAAWH